MVYSKKDAQRDLTMGQAKEAANLCREEIQDALVTLLDTIGLNCGLDLSVDIEITEFTGGCPPVVVDRYLKDIRVDLQVSF